jgi:hypothetical protein
MNANYFIKFILTGMLIFVSSNAICLEPPKGFLGFNFGASIDECERNIFNGEKKDFENQTTIIMDMKERSIGNINFNGISLIFCKNRLQGIMVENTGEKANSDYKTIFNSLRNKYGEFKKFGTVEDSNKQISEKKHYWEIGKVGINLNYNYKSNSFSLVYLDLDNTTCLLPENKNNNDIKNSL